MAENKLKNMIENHELDNLMTNSDKLEKLKNSETTEQVLEILKKYNYTATKEVFERELLEILQSIELNEEEMRNVSGGKLIKTKNLSVMLGGLMAINSAGFLPVGAVTEQQGNTDKYTGKSLLNRKDKSDALKIGGGAAGIGLLWAIKELVTTNKVNTRIPGSPADLELSLTEEEQKIYEKTKKLSELMLTYVKKYITKHGQKPATTLEVGNPEHSQMLDMIREIRREWISMCERETTREIDQNAKKLATENKKTTFHVYAPLRFDFGSETLPVALDSYAIETLYCGLPIGETEMKDNCMPANMNHADKHPYLLSKLFLLDHEHKIRFTALEELRKRRK